MKAKSNSGKVVLAYSGGLDTSVILKWLINKGYEVVCFIADVGQYEDFEKAKAKAADEGNKIVAAAKAEAEQQAVKARESLREQVAALAVKGAEQILRKEVNADVHADLLSRLKTEL